VSAADAREQLEAVIRRQLTAITRPGRGRVTHNEAVGNILGAADYYGDELLAQRLNDRARERRLAAAEASAAEHRERLELATAERTGKAS
jgi:hypothetical protein